MIENSRHPANQRYEISSGPLPQAVNSADQTASGGQAEITAPGTGPYETTDISRTADPTETNTSTTRRVPLYIASDSRRTYVAPRSAGFSNVTDAIGALSTLVGPQPVEIENPYTTHPIPAHQNIAHPRWYSTQGNAIFIKRRDHTERTAYAEGMAWLADVRRGGDPHAERPVPAGVKNEKICTQEHMSLLHEIEISDAVYDRLRQSDVQRSIRRAKFTGLTAITPLAAMIDRRDGQRYVAYRYVNGEVYRESVPANEISSEDRPHGSIAPGEMYERLTAVAEYLGDTLRDEGIYPYELGAQKFIVRPDGKDSHLSLIGMEHYSRRVDPRYGIYEPGPQPSQNS
jgi:hypothetical protein